MRRQLLIKHLIGSFTHNFPNCGGGNTITRTPLRGTEADYRFVGKGQSVAEPLYSNFFFH